MEHGLHQELDFSRSSGTLRMQMAFFLDRVENPLVDGGGEISAADWKSGDLLYDSSTGAIEVAADAYTGTGLIAALRATMPDNMWVALTGGTGDALQMSVLPLPVTIQNGLLS